MKNKIKKIVPAGFPLKTELLVFAASYLFSLGYSVVLFLDRFLNLPYYLLTFKTDNYRSEIGFTIKDTSAVASFDAFIDKIFIFFSVTVLLMCVFCVLHIIYHYQGSKSIYLMKRLPKKSEYYVRTLTLPLTSIILCAVTVLLLVNLFYYLYITGIKAEYIPENHFESSWRYFVWIRK